MAWTEDGYDRHVLDPRRALRQRIAERLDAAASHTPHPHHLRALAARLRDSADGEGDRRPA